MKALVTFMSTAGGRWLRIIVGAALIAVGVMLGGGWWALAAVGAVFVLVGAFNVCLLAPLAGLPVSGSALRR